MIWLFLLGLSKFASGHYTTIDVVSTVVMAGCSGAGIMASIPLGRSLSIGRRIVTAILFAVVQVGVMLVSFLDPIANR